MKKMFIVLTLLLAANIVFAEASFMGIPMGITKAEAEKNRTSYEEKIQKAFSYFCQYAEISFNYTLDEPKVVCGFSIEFDNSRFGYLVATYLLDNKYKPLSNEYYYNDDFFVYTDRTCIAVTERNNFNNAMKSLMK